MRGGSVAVVGGSIAGSAFAGAAARLGAEQVVVLERSPGRLEDRGVGICIQNERFDELVRAGLIGDDVRRHRLTTRRWVTASPGERDPRGRELWHQPMPFHSHHWAVLWQALRERTPDTVEFRPGTTVTTVGGDQDGAWVSDTGGEGGGGGGSSAGGAGGAGERFDLVIGADGYRSAVRAAVCPEARPEYAGYVCWRGSYDAALLEDGLPDGGRGWPSDECTTVCYPGGQVVIYRIPGLHPGTTQVNWVFYAPTPEWLEPAGPTSIPAGSLTDQQLDELDRLADQLPPYWAAVVGLTPRERTLLQPLYDLAAPRLAAGRLLLGGDAATVVRPHNTSGAVKALQDAYAFEQAGREAARTGGSWSTLLSAYDRERTAAGRELVELGRKLGRAQVTTATDWPAMTEQSMSAWWQQQLIGGGGFGGQPLARSPKPPQA
ncbi:FAD-dependent monooxygenase [Kitasatospora sp. NPDC097643]|uniref:FAD-dependent monooxygenase n=1 Tax=Kitasatospora sp. NPDC097643 TaxID=3157230 RepID=UPI0033335FF7